MAQYLLDANAFIDAHRRYYQHSFCPAFWDFLSQNDSWCSIRNVYDELIDSGDFVSDWVKEHQERFHEPTGEYMGEILEWVGSRNYKDTAIHDFVNCADCWVIEYAKEFGITVISHEAPAPHSRKSVKMPDVCNAFDVEYVDLFSFMKKEQARFVLG